jgi:hypothetical protein
VGLGDGHGDLRTDGPSPSYVRTPPGTRSAPAGDSRPDRGAVAVDTWPRTEDDPRRGGSGGRRGGPVQGGLDRAPA